MPSLKKCCSAARKFADQYNYQKQLEFHWDINIYIFELFLTRLLSMKLKKQVGLSTIAPLINSVKQLGDFFQQN